MITDAVLFKPVIVVNDHSALFFSNISESLHYVKACNMACYRQKDHSNLYRSTYLRIKCIARSGIESVGNCCSRIESALLADL